MWSFVVHVIGLSLSLSPPCLRVSENKWPLPRAPAIYHDYPVPVGKHGSVKVLPHPKQLSIFSAEILHAGRAAIDMKHIKQDFSLKARVPARRVDLGGVPRPKLNFSKYGHVAYQINADDVCSNMVANILSTDTALAQGVGSKGQTIYFLWKENFMLHIKLKGIEHRAPWKQIYCHYTYQRPLGWGQNVIFLSFLKVVMLHIKLNLHAT